MPSSNSNNAGEGGDEGRTLPWRDPVRLAFHANNALSLLGLILIGLGLMGLVTSALFALVAPQVNPYFGIVTYLVLPVLFVLGLILVPVGMLLKRRHIRRQVKRQGGKPTYARVDLNDPATRRKLFRSAVFFTLFTGLVVLPVVGVSSYYGYRWTESTEFCGKLCHSVMEPQDVAHDRSSHARVACAECHIGPGASWFVKSKITGVGQVVAVATDSYPRPIPNAITNLRPARETCEECHWPARFFGSQYREWVHYMPDEANKRFVVRMLVKTGGADRLTGRVEGIHMHMVLYGRIEYVATDPDLQHIPWVRHTLPSGESVIYRSDGKPSSAPRPEGTVRLVDCMDCHNRAAHQFFPPQRSLDLYMGAGRIDSSLPYFKRQAVAALVENFKAGRENPEPIAVHLSTYYQQNHHDLWMKRQGDIVWAAGVVKQIYQQNFFPYMKEDWQTYPDNIGHKNSPGCFRCHDGLHMNQHGQAIRSGCNICHVFLDPVTTMPESVAVGPFQHPIPLALHRHLRCSQCHDGGPLLSCRDCHAEGSWLAHRGKTEFRYEAE